MRPRATSRSLIAVVAALGSLIAASAAHARADIHLSIGLPAPHVVVPAPVYVQPAPVYVQPAPVYGRPVPIYAPGPVFVQPAPHHPHLHSGWSHGRGHGHGRRGPWGDADRDGIPNAHDRHPHRHDGRANWQAGRGDRDRDGVPNRHDRAPHNPYRY
ncbi:hypothetical protein WG922_16980 [Ramlibacter sp. AN1015]|uniref:hypothetical protein n=1 Tax=Ramlibacter sp. AN1015 TaxID=3133428 RepID=UPI0030BEA15D